MRNVTRGAIAGLAIAVVGLTGFSASALAAGPGYGDVTDAVIYGPSGPIGAPLEDLIDQDDEVTTVPAPFPINFFGTKYDALCITTNGTISPVLTSNDTCSDEYDEDLDNLARSSGAPIIAVLALDLDPSEDLWRPGVAGSTISATNNVVTVTTSAPHGFAVGDRAYFFGGEDPDFSGEQDYLVTSVPDATSFTFDRGVADFASRAMTGTVSSGPYEDELDDTNNDGLADDGFGNVKSVYYGTTTIDGKQAVVVTWYRVPNNDDDNDPSLFGTLQLVIIQEPTENADTAGSDFTVQFNFGTMRDNEDGYSAADGGDSCDAAEDITDCRWAMGWADYDGTTDPATTDVYDLFGTRTINSLIDAGGPTSIVANRLNSDIAGRYTWKMIDGVTVGFAVPTMDGNDPGTLPRDPGAPVTVPEPAAAAKPQLAETGAPTLPVGLIGGATLLAGLGALTLAGVTRRRTSNS